MMSEKQKAAEKTERRDEKDMQEKERELLYGTADQFGIYQLKDGPELSRLQFKGTWTLKQAGILKENAEAVAISPENYDLVYTGDLAELVAKTYGADTAEEKLHAIFEELNIYKPADYTGRSLSVSDVVVLHEQGKNTAHYVDSTDYTEMPHFIRRLEMWEKGRETVQEWQKTEPVQSEGRLARHGSLRKTLEECMRLSAKEGKEHPAKKQEKETSL